MFGLFNINKPAGPTSHDVINAIRRRLFQIGPRVKAGHAGTLDPFAGGVLVICVGPATRLVTYVQSQPKRYVAEITLGATSTTDDTEGEITQAADATAPPADAVSKAIAGFVGEIQQVPPAHSAVHVNGRRAYKLARAGQTPDLQPRPVKIRSIDLVRFEYPHLEIDVTCETGTYIRALARDIGAALGVGGYCSRLTRTAIGPFTIDLAVAPAELDPARDLLSPLAALENIPKITIDSQAVGHIAHGRNVELETQMPPGEVAVLDAAGQLIAIAAIQDDGATGRPIKVFVRQDS